MPDVHDRSGQRRTGPVAEHRHGKGQRERGTGPGLAAAGIRADVGALELPVDVVGTLGLLRPHHAGGHRGGGNPAGPQAGAGQAEQRHDLPAGQEAADGVVVEAHTTPVYRGFFRNKLTSSELIRSGAVQPRRSYSAMHDSAKARKLAAAPLP